MSDQIQEQPTQSIISNNQTKEQKSDRAENDQSQNEQRRAQNVQQQANNQSQQQRQQVQDRNGGQNTLRQPTLMQQSSSSSQQPGQFNDRLSEFENCCEIGRGAYGVVRKVKNKKGVYLAMKQVDSIKLNKDKKTHQVYMEKIMRHFKFPGIPDFYSCFTQESKFYFLMAYAEGGQLQKIIKKYHQYLTFEVVQFFVAEMVLILEYIHSLGFSHRDFKPENLVLTKDGHLQLIDFGTLNDYCKKLIPPQALDDVKLKDNYRRSKITIEKIREVKRRQQEAAQNNEMSNGSAANTNQNKSNEELLQPTDLEEIEQRMRSQTFCGTAEYLCPEMLEDDICDMNGDLWALGCIIYKIFTNNTPFVDSQEFLIFNKIKQGIYNKNHEQIPPVANDLISKLLVLDQYERLGSIVVDETITKETVHEAYKKLKSHPFFDGIVWQNLFKQTPPQMILQIISGEFKTIKKELDSDKKNDQNGNQVDACDSDEDQDDDFEDEEDKAEIYIKNQIEKNQKKNEEMIRNSTNLPIDYNQIQRSQDHHHHHAANSAKKPLNLNNRNTYSEESSQSPTKIQRNSSKPNSNYKEIVQSLKPPFTEENLAFQSLMNKVNKKLLFFEVKRPRQILLFNADPIRIIYYIPNRKKLMLKYIIIDENTSIQLEGSKKIIITDQKDKYVFQDTEHDYAQQLQQSIQNLQQLKNQQQN